MTLHQLRILAAVARHLSVTKAAKELHISQPSVTQQLKLLEAEWAVKFHRKAGRGIELTEEGRSFLNDSESILFQVEKLRRKFADNLNGREDQVLRIGGSYGPCAAFLPSVAALFRRGHPRVEITLFTNWSPVLEELMLKSQIEIAVAINPSFRPSIAMEFCRKEELVFCASVRHPLAKRTELSPQELEGVPLVIRKGDGEGDDGGALRIVNQLEGQGLKPNIVMHCEFPEAVKAAVKAGIGFGILHRDIAEPEVREGHLKVIRVSGLEMRVDSFIIYHKERPLSSNAVDFLGLLRQRTLKTRFKRPFSPSGALGREDK